jgi:hypothetical protein
MNQSPSFVLSNNKLRRMQGWARAIHPGDWHDRCAIVAEYLVQQDADLATRIVQQGWPAVFAAAERDWPEAFAAMPRGAA